MIASVRLTGPQASVVEIFVEDPAHDDERAPWWPRLDGRRLVWNAGDEDAICMLFVEIANAEEHDRGTWTSATALARKVRKAARA